MGGYPSHGVTVAAVLAVTATVACSPLARGICVGARRVSRRAAGRAVS